MPGEMAETGEMQVARSFNAVEARSRGCRPQCTPEQGLIHEVLARQDVAVGLGSDRRGALRPIKLGSYLMRLAAGFPILLLYSWSSRFMQIPLAQATILTRKLPRQPSNVPPKELAP